jgi:CubicO group peptidase (beta-lactamase class C family)
MRTIDKYFPGVPSDKNAITIRHLLSGQSGLPDFFHAESDWDADLAWIDRETAERRILSQELLFRPGTNDAHSHGAFVLLAALVERVSEISYYSFIRENFLDPAGMSRTGEYGEIRGLSVSDFAADAGPQFAGLPNIPPNWGPTSWLIKGSGGMYSTVDDLLKFYDFVRSEKVLSSKYNGPFRQRSVNQDGSDRGFELFSAYRPPDNEAYLFLNNQGDRGKTRQLSRAIRKLVMSGD